LSLPTTILIPSDDVGVLQGVLLSGTLFVNQTTSAAVQAADYISQLFPNFGPPEINAAVAQYAGLGTNLFQMHGIMGECKYARPYR
jgi:hypothetical protein